MPKQRSVRRKKRKFCGNQFTKADECTEIETSTSESAANISTASSRKLSSSPRVGSKRKRDCSMNHNDQYVEGFRFIGMVILGGVVSLLKCPTCECLSLILMESSSKRHGCASELRIMCEGCGWLNTFFTSKKQRKSFEVNRRLVYAMRSIGKGHSGAKKFCAFMNMPQPSKPKPYQKSSKTITKHLKSIARKTMSDAADEIRNLKKVNNDEVADCAVSCDGTWQRRCFSSLNGCVTVMSIDTGKVLDTGPLSRTCKQCQLHSHLDKEGTEYQTWKANHTQCSANFRGSAPAMEPEGALRMFKRSEMLHKLRYTELYGDGDSKSYSQVKDVYKEQDIEVVKQECIGHVQKRVGTALRNLKKETPGLGGKGKLTDAMIDKLQNYYGIAFRANVKNAEEMEKAVLASFFHCVSSQSRPLHDYCPDGPDSWCGLKKDKRTYKHGSGLPLPIIAKGKPIYQRLSDKTLLKKCLHGKTQNQNESLNALVWQRVPKEVFVAKETIEIGLYGAIAHFNNGAQTVLSLYKALGISPGKYTEAGCETLDRDHLYKAAYKEQETDKKRRKVLRGQKKKKEDKKKDSEGVTYGAGQF